MSQENGDSSSEESQIIVYGDVERSNLVDFRYLLPKDNEGKTPKNMEQQIEELSLTSVESHEDDSVGDERNKRSPPLERQNDAYTTPPTKVHFWMKQAGDDQYLNQEHVRGAKSDMQVTVFRSGGHIQRACVLQKAERVGFTVEYTSIHQQLVWEVSNSCTFHSMHDVLRKVLFDCVAFLIPSYLVYNYRNKERGQRTTSFHKQI